MRGLLTVCAAGLPFAAASAHAGTETLELTIRGAISPRCEIAIPDRAVDFILTEDAGATMLPFSVNCNRPMAVEMRSLNGGFEHSKVTGQSPYPGFTNLVRYRASFAIDREGATPLAAQSDAMTSGARGAMGVIPYETTGRLSLSWGRSAPLLGGNYKDVIEIRISGD